MHELALAEGVIAAALQVAEVHGLARIARVAVTIGELQQIDREVFAGAIRELLPVDCAPLAETCFDLRLEPAQFRCRACGCEFGLAEAGSGLGEEASEAIHFIPEAAHAYLRCAACGSPDFEVVRGRGVWIEEIEGIE